MPNCKHFLVTEAERKNVRRRVRFQQHRDASCQVFFLSGLRKLEQRAKKCIEFRGEFVE